MPNRAKAFRSVRQISFWTFACYKCSAPSGAPSLIGASLHFTAISPEVLMKRLVRNLLLLCLVASVPVAVRAQSSEASRWQQRARNVTIARDDWGIAHVHGKTDADAVFGMIYAQAEDDFNRVETNYMNSIGRIAETEGEAAIWRDLRMKMFIDPAAIKQKYDSSPAWLKA